MNDFLHADIFFVVTTVAVVVIALLLIIVLIYFIKVLNRIKNIAEQIREETILFREDIHDLRDAVRREGFKMKSLYNFFTGLIPKNTKKSK